jgi:hypothetical protein
MKIQDHRLLQTSSYSLKAVVNVEVPLSVYGSSSTQAFYNSLSSNWKQDASTTENDIEAGIESFDSTVLAQTKSAVLSPSYTTVNEPSDSSSSAGLYNETIAGIVAGGVAFLFCILLVGLYYCGCLQCVQKSDHRTEVAAEASVVAANPNDHAVTIMADAVVIVAESDIRQRDIRQRHDTVGDKQIPSAPPGPLIEDDDEEEVSQELHDGEITLDVSPHSAHDGGTDISRVALSLVRDSAEKEKV